MSNNSTSDNTTSANTSAPTQAFSPLPLGSIKPQGWLLNQLRTQASGLTGHLEEFWPDIGQSRWIGGEAEGWERGPYWLDGAIPLAFVIDDPQLQERVRYWVDYILEHQHEDGWLGSKEDPHVGSGEEVLDPWPLFVLFKALAQWHEATADARVLPAMTRAMKRVAALLNETPLDSWAKMRWPDFLWGIAWLHARTGESWLLELAQLAQQQGYDWNGHFADFQLTEKQSKWTLENHVVNHAMALKEPAVRYRLNGEVDRQESAHNFINVLNEWHGQATGVFSGDESLAGKSPSQGTELCAVVEYMFSLEELTATFGDVAFADRLERIAFNALPATCTPDMWAHQYDQQINQVLVSVAKRDWVSNGDDANIYGLEPNFGCCTANMHQGWPKLASSMWMATPDFGLAAVVLGPNTVKASVAGGAQVTIKAETEYPFGDTVRFTIRTAQPVEFPLYLRIPAWAADARLEVGDEQSSPDPGTFHKVLKQWHDGDNITLQLPMPIRFEERPDGAVAVLRGPLLYALKIGEEFRHLRGDLPHADWEVHPTTPWNYGLPVELLTTDSTAAKYHIRSTPVSSTPFAPDVAPVTIEVPASRIPQWTMHNNSAAPPPASPVTTCEPVEIVELIPYGCTNLRIAEFPVVDTKSE